MANHWDIEEQPSGEFEVTKNRRAFAYGLETLEQAVKKIKRSRFFKDGDSVTLTDQDGYRSPVRMY